MRTITMSAPAKINLSLDVTGKLENGYHALETIMQTISLWDDVLLEKTVEGIGVFCDHPGVPCDAGNICDKAARAFFQKTSIPGGVKIKIMKRIPVGAGLAGGSSDAAAVLKGLNALYDAELTQQELADIGVICGADVPFCLAGGTCLAGGIGEKLTRLPSFAGIHAVLVTPEFSVSTAWVFQNYRMDDPVRHPDTKQLIAAIRNRDVARVAGGMKNVLESVTAVKYPEIEGIKHELKSLGALGSVMSGSGSSVFGLFENREKAFRAISELRGQYGHINLVTTTDGGENYGEADKN